MPGDTITEVRVDKSKLGITIGSGRGAPKEPEKQYLEDLFQVKLVTGNGVRGEEGGGAVMPYDAPSQQALDDSKTLAEAKKKLDEARKEANTLARELSEAAGQTKSVSDFRGIRSPEERYKQAKDFKEALEKVPAVLAKFTVIEGAATFRMEEAEARDAKNGGKPVPKATTPEEWNTLRLQAVQARSGVRENGLPSGFAVKEGPEWHKVLIAELQPFCKGKDQKENEDLRATDLKAALSDDAKKKVAQAGKQFKETVQPYLSKGVNRASLFFDATTNGVPLSLEDGKKAKAAIDTLSQQGIAILNNGGSVQAGQGGDGRGRPVGGVLAARAGASHPGLAQDDARAAGRTAAQGERDQDVRSGDDKRCAQDARRVHRARGVRRPVDDPGLHRTRRLRARDPQGRAAQDGRRFR